MCGIICLVENNLWSTQANLRADNTAGISAVQIECDWCQFYVFSIYQNFLFSLM